MRVDAYPDGQWLDLNEKAKDYFELTQPRVSARVYRGVAHALKELTLGLTEAFAHKKSVAILQHASPWFDSVDMMLSRHGFLVQRESVFAEGLQEWVEQLDGQTLFALVPEDHAITGEYFENAELVSQLVAKKIFVIRVSHFKHLFPRFTGLVKGEVGPFEMRVFSGAPNFSAAVLGGRCRFNPVVAPDLPWFEDEGCFHRSFAQRHEDETKIREFESSALSPFSNRSQRIWDRALLQSDSVSGDWLRVEIMKDLGLEDKDAGSDCEVETAHLCRWDGFRNWPWAEAGRDWARLLIVDVGVVDRVKTVLSQNLGQ